MLLKLPQFHLHQLPATPIPQLPDPGSSSRCLPISHPFPVVHLHGVDVFDVNECHANDQAAESMKLKGAELDFEY